MSRFVGGMKKLIGQFNHSRNCSLPHHLPQGEMADGMPVVVFPKNTAEPVLGRTYEFMAQLTRKATYVIDDVTYRVAHAIALEPTDGNEAGYLDKLLHGQTGIRKKATVADRLDDKTRSGLEALKARLEAQQS